MNSAFWKGKKVLITGHTGFKGGWLALWLQHLEASVIGYAQSAHTEPSLFELADVAAGMVSVMGDVCDLKRLETLLAEHRPEVVFHLAAQSLVRYSYANPLETYATNVMGTVNMHEAVRRSEGVRALVVVTSDKCYENKEWLWGYRENEALGGRDPYSSSKGCAELVTGAYRDSFFAAHDFARHGVAVASGRAGNVIGGGDWAEDRLIPDVVKALTAGRAVSIRNPRAVRAWQHVLEPLHGYLVLAQRLLEEGPEFTGAWNFGPYDDDAKPVSWIVERLARLWGAGARWEVDPAQHPHEAASLKLDSSKARALLGWKPTLDLATALAWVVDWYKLCAEKGQMREFSRGQISRFEEMAAVSGGRSREPVSRSQDAE